jgi:single-stranded DNA-specific DHH superfamily exonuclease
LKELNDSRKNLTTQGVEWAIAYIESRGIEKDLVLVIYLPEVHESLAGIIAGKIRERYNRPVLVLTRGQNEIKGSGRSVEAYSMYEELSKISAFFSKFGGHKLAAGFSLKSWEELHKEGIIHPEASRQADHEKSALTYYDEDGNVGIDGNCDEDLNLGDKVECNKEMIDNKDTSVNVREEMMVDALRQALQHSCLLSEEDYYQKVVIDIQMPMSYATMELAQELEQLEPFGTGNPKPLFAQKNVHFLRGFRIGAKQNFAKFRVAGADGIEQELLYFGNLDQFLIFLVDKFGEGADQNIFLGKADYEMAVTYQVGINSYKGRDSLQFVMQNYA